jgi:hypothetical protein
VRTALVRVCRAWWYDLRLEQACVGYGDGHGESSPAKQEDCEGVTTMRRAVSLRGFSDIVPLKAETDDLEEDKGYCNLEEIHRGETAPGGLFICPKTRATLGIPLKVNDTSLDHFMVQVITLTSALTNT